MKVLRALVVLGIVQAGLILGYLGIDALRTGPEAPFTWERLDAPAHTLVVERADAPAAVPKDLVLVHFWATWCAPCEAELPALLEAAEASGVPLLAVTDEPWPVVVRHFGGDVPEGIVRDPTGEAAAAWRVSGLPDTFVVRDDRVIGRMGGPRDWASSGARRFLAEARKGR